MRARHRASAIAAAAFAFGLAAAAKGANAEAQRTLSLYNIHTKETLVSVYKRNGKLVKQWKLVPAAKVQIQLLGKNGNVISTITRTVPVNKAYTISNLKLPKAAASVRTSVKA